MSRQAINIAGCMPLHLAAWNGHLDILQHLLKDKGEGDISVVDSRGNTPLHYAVYNNRTEVVKYIVQHHFRYYRSSCWKPGPTIYSVGCSNASGYTKNTYGCWC